MALEAEFHGNSTDGLALLELPATPVILPVIYKAHRAEATHYGTLSIEPR